MPSSPEREAPETAASPASAVAEEPLETTNGAPVEPKAPAEPTAPESAAAAPAAAVAPAVAKVKVHFVPVGSAPILKKTKFQIGADQRFLSVHAFLRRVLKLPKGDSLFLYSSSAFCPGPEELVGDLNECFSKRGELVIHYSLQEAWG